jgi:tryptophan synthase alpha chain
MTNRIETAFARVRDEGRVGVIPYVTVGFPELADTVPIVTAIEAAGADIIELGVPYSDPLADGPSIQAASYRALQNGVTPAHCIAIVRELRTAGVQVPLLFMGYYNLILSYGIEAYARDCAEAGLDGLIVPDLPSEEDATIRAALSANGLTLTPLLAPTSPEERIRKACASADGFIYCVSVVGVTGARSELPANLGDFLARVRRHTSLPLAVGFGISERRHVEQLAGIAQAAVVGSRVIDVINSAPPDERAQHAGDYVAELAGRTQPTEDRKS